MTVMRSFDPVMMEKALALSPKGLNSDIDCKAWLDNHNNVMFVDGEDVGLATFEYPGLYNLHWFFNSRGRDAIKQAHRMMDEFFQTYDVKTVRGLTPEAIKAARWLARQIGFTSYGLQETNDGPYELFIMTKDEFYKSYEGKK